MLAQTLAIFREETEEHLATISAFLHVLDSPSIDEFNGLIRAVHTIRGSSGMVGMNSIFTASSHVENVLKLIDPEHYAEQLQEQQLLLDYYEYVSSYIALLANDHIDEQQIAALDQQFEHIWQVYNESADAPSAGQSAQGIVSQLLELEINDVLDAEFAFADELQGEAPAEYLCRLTEQADVLLAHTQNKQTETLQTIGQRLKQCYQALLAHPLASQDQDLVASVQDLHHYLIDAFDGLASGQNITLSSGVLHEFDDVVERISQPHDETAVLSDKPDESADSADAMPLHDDVAERHPEESTQPSIQFDPELLDIFLDESDELIEGMDADFAIWQAQPEDSSALKNLFRHLHTLKGGANMLQAHHLGDIAHELESIYERILKGQLIVDQHSISFIRYAQDSIAQRIERLRLDQVDEADPVLVDQLRAISQGRVISAEELAFMSGQANLQTQSGLFPEDTHDGSGSASVAETSPQTQTLAEPLQVAPIRDANTRFDEDLLDIFLEESDELVAGMDADFTVWQASPANTAVLKNLLRYLHTLKGGANMVQATHLGDIAHELESIYERILKGQIQPDRVAIDYMRFAQDNIATRIEQLRRERIDPDDPGLIAQLNAIAMGHAVSVTNDMAAPAQAIEVPAMTAPVDDRPDPDDVAPYALVNAPVEDTVTEPAASPAPVLALAPPAEPEDDFEYDIDRAPIMVQARQQHNEDRISIVEAYLEEAAEWLIQGEQGFDELKIDRTNRSLLLVLQRNYHSLKGSSRVVGEQLISVIAYQLELLFERFGTYQFSGSQYDYLIHEAQQWLKRAIFRGTVDGATELKTRLQAIIYQQSPAANQFITENLIDLDHASQVIVVQGDGATPPPMTASYSQSSVTTQSEMLRVSPETVEKMIDLAGENSINRSRIELELGQMNFTLSELGLAIQRLADQLRRMDVELEAQILTRHQIDDRDDDFDPLEMDQYSSLNQLSKSLAESASDLIDFKTTLSDKVRDTEDLLLQQSRIQTELQQNLMGTRLVPFARHNGRLERLVRQVATQLNRQVRLDIQNTEGELDRHILEKLMTPLEHMLRNAIDHGLEDEATRIAAGKPATGAITLNIARDGNDILVMLADDGRGIDTAAVKRKAVQNDLIDANSLLSDEDLMQFIFHSGLSTAEQVTQISGRGVGLDVVQNDIKSLGGHVSVQSVLGQGTQFTIRVPTTVSVTDALMVKVGDQQFAIPLTQIERIIRVSPVALNQYYDSHDNLFSIDGTSYRLRYVGEFVSDQGQARPAMLSMGGSVPVIVFNSNGRLVAMQIDQLIGSRAQIVIKPIGQQLSSIGILSGATILADGRVALILDGQALARRALTSERPVQPAQELAISNDMATQTRTRKLVMVVDDSVTVRKVTTRLLERQGYAVVTAKDGLEAVELMASHKPDIMLLDIEMPRMDGFEVAYFVRNESSQPTLPIIMITSRTGEKHREHAMSLAVDRYLGKPFQEEELLQNMAQLLEPVAQA